MKAAAQIFLSYARLDKEEVENLYQRLSRAGFKPWMDTQDIVAGEKWEPSIRLAIRKSDFFLACLSANSVSKRGFLQTEIRDALGIWQQKLDSDIYLIPVRLEICEVPESLSNFQWVDLFEKGGWTRLKKAIQVGIERRAEITKTIVPKPPPSEPYKGHKTPYARTKMTGRKEGPTRVRRTYVTSIEFRLDRPLERFSEEGFKAVLQDFFGTNIKKIRIVSIQPGSIKIIFKGDAKQLGHIIEVFIVSKDIQKDFAQRTGLESISYTQKGRRHSLHFRRRRQIVHAKRLKQGLSRKFSGVIRIDDRAMLETKQGTFTLIPYPTNTPIDMSEMEWVGRDIFAYLKNKQAVVRGEPSGALLFNAKVAESRLPIKDVVLGAERYDRFSAEIEQHFKKDSHRIGEKLNAAGIMTVSALYHRIRDFEPEVSAFSKYLEVPEDAIRGFLSAIEKDRRNQSLVAAPPKVPVTRGVNLKRVAKMAGVPVKLRASAAPPPFPDSAKTPSLPSEVDLVERVTSVKDQGPFRGTCVAHAGVALLEFELINRGPDTKRLDLSEQYLYWGCKQIDGAADEEGTLIEYAVEILDRGVQRGNVAPGVCKERDWRYHSVSIAENESHDPPPKKAINAKKYAISRYTKLRHNSIKDLKTALADNHCVGLSVFTYHFWTDGYAWREGVISLPFRIKPDGAHAICLVGYKDNDATHRDGYFIFKNSWGTNWGAGRPDPGFGSLPYRYVLKEGIEAWTVEL